MAKQRPHARLTCYHNIPFDQVSFDKIVADPKFTDDDEERSSYGWLGNQVGFYPIFLALGRKKVISMTRYGHQFFRIGNRRSTSNNVLFEFRLDALPKVVFTDYGHWCVINSPPRDGEPDPIHVRKMFKPSWSRKQWLEYADVPGWHNNVQLLVPELDLRLCKRVWARNLATKRKLERMGFKSVGIRRQGYIKYPER